MKKSCKLYLLISFTISYICFGIIAYNRIPFKEVFASLQYILLFVLGCLGPFISSLIVYSLNIDNLGGVKGFKSKICYHNFAKSVKLIFLFIFTHYGFSILLNNIQGYGNIVDFFYYLPIMLILMGSQEIGWRSILQPNLEVRNGFWKSSISTGLIWALWFLPLIFIPNFLILPHYYSQFAAYLVGLSFMLTTLYKVSGSILYSIILSACIFALYPVLLVKQGFMQVGIVLIEALVVSMVKNKNLDIKAI
ncbi:CPBP family intramembrane glutamic endopeptidase [Tissierella sp. Yu-01]|uniref:CPBP family intramembrane glutamic endopeptidase n=1 Tax=Tissierella sp. Yu-01 TaxID=3035694 RepID=UPI00240DA5FE|nr:CPBP family intramembrane glutamic endopeptidase [Tissierella sp. Yu-01]WFA08930.1 CPBP family intramembrane metalloprotease [Tissierella sp. Yu-01]